MREDVKEWLLLMGKSAVFLLGGILVMAGLVDLVVAGINLRAALVLLLGLLMTVPWLVLAFRDALKAARQGRSG